MVKLSINDDWLTERLFIQKFLNCINFFAFHILLAFSKLYHINNHILFDDPFSWIILKDNVKLKEKTYFVWMSNRQEDVQKQKMFSKRVTK